MCKMLLWRLCLILSMAALICGCGLSDDDCCEDLADLEVTITAGDTLCSSSDPVTITVRAENRGSRRVVFGYGSSSCQLHSFVREDEDDYFIPDFRICTRDIAEQALAPGESRTESWTWDGKILKNQGVEALPPGKYEVYGAAGAWISGASVVIEVLQQDRESPDLPRVGPTVQLDLDGNGSSNFHFKYSTYVTDDVPPSFATNFLAVWPYRDNRVQGALPQGSIPLPDGSQIDGSLEWTDFKGWLVAIRWSIHSGWESRWSGPWAGVDEMSLAVQLVAGDTSYFGWVKLSVDAQSGEFVIHDYAYQPVAGEPLLAGVHP